MTCFHVEGILLPLRNSPGETLEPAMKGEEEVAGGRENREMFTCQVISALHFVIDHNSVSSPALMI